MFQRLICQRMKALPMRKKPIERMYKYLQQQMTYFKRMYSTKEYTYTHSLSQQRQTRTVRKITIRKKKKTILSVNDKID